MGKGGIVKEGMEIDEGEVGVGREVAEVGTVADGCGGSSLAVGKGVGVGEETGAGEARRWK